MKQKTNKIIPSTELKCVSVHKLRDFACPRRYFWRRVLNLQSKNLNMNFWYGSVLGAGFEAILLGKKNWKQLMRKESHKCLEGYDISKLGEEIDLQLRLIEVILEQAKVQAKQHGMSLIKSQVPVEYRLRCDVTYCGTEDGEGVFGGKRSLYEIKTASKVNQGYLDSLKLDKQINSYCWATRKSKQKHYGQCTYCIFKKPQKRLKKKQTVDDFVDEIAQDCIDRPEMYYEWLQLSLVKPFVDSVGQSIERMAEILKQIYDSLTKEQLLNPNYWPEMETKCSDYSGCEFLPLCLKPNGWKMYLRFYKQRTMLYDLEKEELEQ
jgi:hypothetical protein